MTPQPGRDERIQTDAGSRPATKLSETSAARAIREADPIADIDRLREELMADQRTRLKIEKHEDTGRFIYKMFNPDTGELITRWPPERYFELRDFLTARVGAVVDARY